MRGELVDSEEDDWDQISTRQGVAANGRVVSPFFQSWVRSLDSGLPLLLLSAISIHEPHTLFIYACPLATDFARPPRGAPAGSVTSRSHLSVLLVHAFPVACSSESVPASPLSICLSAPVPSTAQSTYRLFSSSRRMTTPQMSSTSPPWCIFILVIVVIAYARAQE